MEQSNPESIEITVALGAGKSIVQALGKHFQAAGWQQIEAELEDDENLSIDGIKELLISARKYYQDDMKRRARKITPNLLRQCLKYVHNLTLFEKRFSPDLYTIVTAAKQTAGDQYALNVAETAREYPYAEDLDLPRIHLGVDRGRLPDGEIVRLVSPALPLPASAPWPSPPGFRPR